MSTHIDLYADKGSTFSVAVSIKNKDGSAYDCSSYSVRGQVRKNYKSEYGVNLSCDFLNQVNGEISISLDSTDTRDMKAGRYYYDVELFTSIDGTVTRVLEGQFEVSERVTNESSNISLGDSEQVTIEHANRTDNPHSVGADQIGLGSVDNTADVDKPISNSTQTSLDLKSDKSNTYTKTEVDTKVADLVDSAPGTLDTLNELASALGDDPNFATTVTNLVGDNTSLVTDHIDDKENPHEVSLSKLTDVNLTVLPSDGQGIIWDSVSGKWLASDIDSGPGGGAVDSVNTQTGVVVLDADDISDSGTTNKFATQAELDKANSALQATDPTLQSVTDNGAITTNDITVGSIVVSGTVDGRDVAADGLALDAIVANPQDVPVATTTTNGIVEIASQLEINDGLPAYDKMAVTPWYLKNSLYYSDRITNNAKLTADSTNVVAALDGAPLTDVVTPSVDDKILIQDTSDTNKLKYVNISDLPGDTNALQSGDNISELVNDSSYLISTDPTLESVTTNGATTLNDISVGRIVTAGNTLGPVATAVDSIAIGGTGNSATGAQSEVLGGGGSSATATGSTIVGGNASNNSGNWAIIAGGRNHTNISASRSGILGGEHTTVTHADAVMLGVQGTLAVNKQSQADQTTHVDNLHIFEGGFKMPTGATDTYVLTTDATGVGTWQENQTAVTDLGVQADTNAAESAMITNGFYTWTEADPDAYRQLSFKDSTKIWHIKEIINDNLIITVGGVGDDFATPADANRYLSHFDIAHNITVQVLIRPGTYTNQFSIFGHPHGERIFYKPFDAAAEPSSFPITSDFSTGTGDIVADEASEVRRKLQQKQKNVNVRVLK